jgi:hypothetical protein
MAEEAVGFAARALMLVVRLVLQFLFETFLYATGRIVLPLVTFGRWRVIAMTDHKSDAGVFCKRQPDGTLLFDDGAGMIIGGMIWIVIGLLVFAGLRLHAIL